MDKTLSNSRISTADIVKIAIVAALYVAVTLMISPIASGPIQFRVSELFNFLAFYNKRYIWAVTLGCAIANYFSSTSLGWPDVIIGSLSTLIFLSLGVWITKGLEGKRLFTIINLRFLAFSVFFAASMFTIGAELHVILHIPFWLTYFQVAIGEFGALFVGGFIVEALSKVIDLRK